MATNWVESLILNALLRQQSFFPFDTYVGLWQSDPTANGLLVGEISAVGYSRQLVTWSTAFLNENELLWVPSSSWGTMNYVVLLDALTGGNVIDYATHSQVLNASTGLSIPVGSLSVVVP